MMGRLMIATAAAVFAATVEAATFADVLGPQYVENVVRQETASFVGQFQVMTNRRIEVADTFYPAVTEPILAIEAPAAKESADLSLRIRFGSFLSDLTAVLLATQSKLVFGKDEVFRYLEAARKAGRCGRVPCPMGCPQACDKRCNPCPRP